MTITGGDVRSRYAAKLHEVQEHLRLEGIEFRTLGSVASAAYLGPAGWDALDFSRRGARGAYQRMPDVDLVLPMADYPRAKRYRDRLERDPDMAIGVEILPSVCHFDFRPGDDISYLTHRALRTEIPTALLDPVEVPFLDTTIVSVDPLTLFHTFVTLGGMLRPKDWAPAVGLARRIRNERLSRFTESDMEPFHRFLAERRRRYPSYRRYRRAANWLRYRVPDPLHHAGVYYGRYLQPVVFGNEGRPR